MVDFCLHLLLLNYPIFGTFRNTDPDLKNCSMRIQFGSGSTTLVLNVLQFTVLYLFLSSPPPPLLPGAGRKVVCSNFHQHLAVISLGELPCFESSLGYPPPPPPRPASVLFLNANIRVRPLDRPPGLQALPFIE